MTVYTSTPQHPKPPQKKLPTAHFHRQHSSHEPFIIPPYSYQRAVAMFKVLKDVKRRAVEQVLYTVGASEKTTDLEYDDYVAHFHDLIADMNECGAALTSVLSHAKDYYTDASELSAALARMYVRNAETPLPGVSSAMEYKQQTFAYRDAMAELNAVYRTSAAAVANEQGLTPLHSAVSTLGPDVEEICNQRNSSVVDFDSHRRRLKTLEQKKEQLESQGKTTTAGYTETIADISKFSNKVATSERTYLDQNAKAKRDIAAAKVAHDRLLESLLITVITVQADLFASTAKKLEAIVSTFPPEKVQQVRVRVNEYIKQGGVQAVKEEKSTLGKSLLLLSGKATLNDLKQEDEKKSHPPQPLNKELSAMNINSNTPKASTPAAVTMSPQSTNSSSLAQAPASVTAPSWSKTPQTVSSPPVHLSSGAHNPFDDNSSQIPQPPSPQVAAQPAIRAPPVTSHAPPPPAFGRVMALYDHVIDADDELAFQTGDIIEVLEKNDDGWWKGRCKGVEGLFPSNYVKPI